VVAYSAIKFFYSHTTPRDWPTLRRLRVPKEKKLPDVLSVDEVRRLIAAVRTPHNRAYFWTVYSLGLRLEEGLRLQVGDIDSQRMMVHVHRGKGAKDRYVPLPSRTLKVLREYWATHRHPQWLFPAKGPDGQPTATADQPMERSSVQRAMSRVVQELEFKKAISIHSLRHNADSRIMPTETLVLWFFRLFPRTLESPLAKTTRHNPDVLPPVGVQPARNESLCAQAIAYRC
jgi:integrase